MSTRIPAPGEVWRRKRGGVLVTIVAVKPWYGDYDIHYRVNDTKRTGAIWSHNFEKYYEREAS